MDLKLFLYLIEILFNWVGLSRNEFNELFLRKLLNNLLESGLVFWQIRANVHKKLLKALVISAGFVISLSFTLIIFVWTLLLNLPNPFDIKVVLLRFLSKTNLKYSLLDLRIEKVALFLNYFNSSWINFFRVSSLQVQYFQHNLSLFHIRCLISLFIHDFDCKVLSFLVTLVKVACVVDIKLFFYGLILL